MVEEMKWQDFCSRRSTVLQRGSIRVVLPSDVGGTFSRWGARAWIAVADPVGLLRPADAHVPDVADADEIAGPLHVFLGAMCTSLVYHPYRKNVSDQYVR